MSNSDRTRCVLWQFTFAVSTFERKRTPCPCYKGSPIDNAGSQYTQANDASLDANLYALYGDSTQQVGLL